jgi:putative membrane protein
MTIAFPGSGEFAAVGIIALLWGIVSLALGIAVIVLIVLGIRWLLRNTAQGNQISGPPPRTGDDAAMVALRERFARGEIDAQEFEERRRILGG